MRTSEWVSLGHPDKIADGISEYILDKIIVLDPTARYALECQIKDNYVSLAGEVTTSAEVVDGDYQKWAREAVNQIGYTKEYQNKWGKENTICGDDLSVVTNISKQSADIAQGVDSMGWGDQGIFFGYAENNMATNGMPVDYFYAKDLGTKLYHLAKDNGVGGLDIKTQITVNDADVIEKVIAAVPCLNEKEYDTVKEFICNWLVALDYNPTVMLQNGNLILNGTGNYQIHGPVGDSGTTGRKLVVDFYGGNSPIGGGSPWTKDGTKADLTLNMCARELAMKGLKTNPNAKYSYAKLNCCIGKSLVRGQVDLYDGNKNFIKSLAVNEEIQPQVLIERYMLNKPIFFKLNEEGLFSLL